MQIPLSACDDINDDQADPSAEISGALGGEQTALAIAVLVARADQLDGRHKGPPPFRGQNLDRATGGEGRRKNKRRGGRRPNRANRRRCPAAAFSGAGSPLLGKSSRINLDGRSRPNLFQRDVAWRQDLL